jgi:signal transduction histidine kinase
MLARILEATKAHLQHQHVERALIELGTAVNAHVLRCSPTSREWHAVSSGDIAQAAAAVDHMAGNNNNNNHSNSTSLSIYAARFPHGAFVWVASPSSSSTIPAELRYALDLAASQAELLLGGCEQVAAVKQTQEVVSRSKNAFVATISHETRTPLNAILGMSTLLSDTPLTFEQRQYVDAISNSGNILNSIITDLLDYGQLESGQMKLVPVPSRMLDVIDTVISVCRESAADKGVDFAYWVAPEAARTFHLDLLRLQQILLNLLSNAIKFTASQGFVFLEVKIVPTTTNSPELQFSVRDSGVGINSDNLRRLFQPFSQVGGTLTRTPAGGCSFPPSTPQVVLSAARAARTPEVEGR